jgi:hypothetical protein
MKLDPPLLVLVEWEDTRVVDAHAQDLAQPRKRVEAGAFGAIVGVSLGLNSSRAEAGG